jgi:hypothetical protein
MADSTWLAVVSAAAGGVGVKILDWALQSRRRLANGDAAVTVKRIDDGATMRKELWDEIIRLRARLDTIDSALRQCREESIGLQAQCNELRIELELMRRTREPEAGAL